MLRSLPEQHKSNWKDHVAKLVHAYNCTRHQTTGYSPFFLLLFGRSPRLPIDLAFKMENANDPTGYPQYVAKWKTAMQEAYAKASTAANKNAKRGKKLYDKKAQSTMLRWLHTLFIIGGLVPNLEFSMLKIYAKINTTFCLF